MILQISLESPPRAFESSSFDLKNGVGCVCVCVRPREREWERWSCFLLFEMVKWSVREVKIIGFRVPINLVPYKSDF